jgi:hypothetical protein
MRERAWHRSVLAAGLAASLAPLVLGLGSCSDDSADGGPSTTERRTAATGTVTTRTSSPSTTQPPASDAEALQTVLDQLLHQWDVAYTGTLADPAAVIDHPEHPVRAEFAAIFTEDSPYLADLDTLVGSFADKDLRVEPSGSGTAQTSQFLRTTAVTDDDNVAFVWCSFDDSAQVQASTGAVVSDEVGISQGEGTAVRLEGVWKIHTLRLLTHATQPAGSPNPCPARAGSAPAGT